MNLVRFKILATYFVPIIIGLSYLFVAFPLAYFRHDDWLILGNGILHFPKDWFFLFKPTLFVDNVESVWFFRPFFKLSAFLFHYFFGLNYYFWLLGTFIFIIGTLLFGSKTIQLITRSSNHGVAFLILFVASLHLHFGSLVWIGEGLMNCPMMFLLMTNLYFFTKTLLQPKTLRSSMEEGLALLFFVLALGFKEAAIAHVGLLFLLITFEPRFSVVEVRTRTKAFAPYTVLSIIYLYYRISVLPLNRGYIPNSIVDFFGVSFQLVLAAIVLPLLVLFSVLFFFERSSLSKLTENLRHHWPLVPFVAITCLPYLGHPFFSPGWLLAPGIYMAFIAVLMLSKADLSFRTLKILSVTLLISTSLPVIWKLNHLGWWYWRQPQRQLFNIFQAQSAHSISKVLIYQCENPLYPSLNLDRVVASTPGLSELWEILHGNRIPIQLASCDDLSKKGTRNPKVLELKWEFPTLSLAN